MTFCPESAFCVLRSHASQYSLNPIVTVGESFSYPDGIKFAILLTWLRSHGVGYLGKHEKLLMEQIRKGFEIALEPIQHILHLRVWGDWDLRMMSIYGKALQEKIADIVARDTIWLILVDMRNFTPQSKVWSLLNRQLTLTNQIRLKKIGYLVAHREHVIGNPEATPSSDSLQQAYFESEPDAIAWLLNELSDEYVRSE